MKMMTIKDNSRFIVTGDIHINLKTRSDFEEDRLFAYANYLKEHRDPESKNFLVLSGDIFDRAKPTFTEIGVFFGFLEILSESFDDIFLIAGNHEVIGREDTVYNYLPEYLFKYIKTAFIEVFDTNVWLVGYPYLDNIYRLYPKNNKNILISHYRSDIGFASEEVDNSFVSETFDYAVLSDIHYKLKPRDNIEYTSSPYSIGFVSKKDFGFTIIDITKKDFKITSVDTSNGFGNKIKLTFEGDDVSEFRLFLKTNIDDLNLYKLVVKTHNQAAFESALSKYTNIVRVTFEDFSEEVEDSVQEIVEDIVDRGDTEIKKVLERIIDNQDDLPDTLKDISKEELRGFL